MDTVVPHQGTHSAGQGHRPHRRPARHRSLPLLRIRAVSEWWSGRHSTSWSDGCKIGALQEALRVRIFLTCDSGFLTLLGKRLALAASRHRHRSCIELHLAMDNPSDKLLLRINKLEASSGGSAEDAAQLQKLKKKLKKLLGRGFLLSPASEKVKEGDDAGEQAAPKSAGKRPVKGRLPPHAAACVHGCPPLLVSTSPCSCLCVWMATWLCNSNAISLAHICHEHAV